MKSLLPKLMSLIGVTLILAGGVLWFTWKPAQAPTADTEGSVPVGSKIIMNDFFVVTFPPETETSTADSKIRAAKDGWKILIEFQGYSDQASLDTSLSEMQLGGKAVLSDVATDENGTDTYFVDFSTKKRLMIISVDGNTEARAAAFEILNAIKWK